jgi:hypothetical protein
MQIRSSHQALKQRPLNSVQWHFILTLPQTNKEAVDSYELYVINSDIPLVTPVLELHHPADGAEIEQISGQGMVTMWCAPNGVEPAKPC